MQHSQTISHTGCEQIILPLSQLKRNRVKSPYIHIRIGFDFALTAQGGEPKVRK
jgi:hypothetical protein